MNSLYQISRLSVITAGLSITLSCLVTPGTGLAAQGEITEADKLELLSVYEKAKADGKHTAAVRHLLEYTEKSLGENAPETVKLTHRYGHLLFQDRDYREATDVLKMALERSTAAFGESGGEAFEINMNIAYSYGQWSQNLSKRMKYFDRALEILREKGEHETIKYVTTLINIAVDLMSGDGLGGDYSSSFSDNSDRFDGDEYSFEIESEYFNYFYMAEKYILEAVEIAKKLENVDEYISSKIAIAQAKLQVMETADLAAVPMGVEGYISGGTERNRYDREEERLMAAIGQLSRDTDTNQIYLDAANKVLMEIAWMDKDESRMATMCTNGVLNSVSEYPPERLYEVMEDGMVLAPELPMSVTKNIFKRRISRREPIKDPDGNPVRTPYFKPVCINGHLMAALIHAPRVTVEEIWK